MVNESGWLSVPVGPDAQRWVTRRGCRVIVVAVHTVVSGQRLVDVAHLVESDPRVQVVYAQAPDVFGRGVGEFIRQIGGLEIPWHQAAYDRFSLVLAASYGGLSELHSPTMVLPHGAAYGKRTPRPLDCRPATRSVYGLGAEQLVQDGRVVPAAIVLSHKAQRDLLAQQCPEALEVALVAGDPCFDRLRASMAQRYEHRAALGVGDRKLVVAASTWGSRSLFSRHGELLSTLLRQLDPCSYQVAALIHPAVWCAHGRRQIRAWLADECAAGLTLIEPEADWRAPVVAADHVVGDHGSVPVYAASVGVPILYTDPRTDDIDEASPQAYVGAHAPRLRPSSPVEAQLVRSAADLPSDWADQVAVRLTSEPGQSHRLLRTEMYRLLGLDMPGRHRTVEPVPVFAERGWCGHV